MDLFVVDTDGTGEQPFLPDEEVETRTVSPDGSLLALVGTNDQGLIVGGTVGTDGKGFHLFDSVDPTLNLACGVWSPDAWRLACEGWDDSNPRRAGVYTVQASYGRAPRRLSTQSDVPCDYSPDGTRLAFIRTLDDDGGGRLMVMDVDGSNAHPLADVHAGGMRCDWSPDGGSILTERNGALLLVTLDGTSTQIPTEGYAQGGAWSPDGSHIAFNMALSGDRFDIYTADADGSDVTRITDSPLLEEAPVWLP